MRAKFIKSQDPKVSLGIGKKHIIELPNGFDMKGPYANKEQAEKLLAELNEEIGLVQKECEDQEIYDDHQMDMLDEVTDEYEPKFNELGYEYIEDWK